MTLSLFPWFTPMPLCSNCGKRSAAFDPITRTFYRMCPRCLRLHRQSNAAGRTKGTRRNPNRAEVRAQIQRSKAVVLATLGNRCGCVDPTCWHGAEACPIDDPDLLTVDHVHGNGWLVRTTKRDGTRTKNLRGHSSNWGRYRRELRNPNHGLQLRCHNCHHRLEAQRRNAKRGERFPVLAPIRALDEGPAEALLLAAFVAAKGGAL